MSSLSAVKGQVLDFTFSRLDALARASSLGTPFFVCACVIIASLLLGGGTRGGFLSDAILEFLAIPALLIALWSLLELPSTGHNIVRRAYWALAFCVAIAFVPLLQLVPLPPSIWTRLAGREVVVSVLNLLGSPLPWMPISLAPDLTWLSILSLLPAMAIFVCAIQLGYRERRAITFVILAVGVLSAFLGLVQIAEGPESLLRFFTITNATEAVGFFANRNHLAALLYVTLLFASCWAIDAAFKMRSLTDIRNLGRARILALTMIFTVIVVLIASEAMTHSRAGLILTIAALAGIFAFASIDRRHEPGITPNRLLLGAVTLAIILIVQFALYRILDRFEADPLADARIPFARNTLRAAWAFMPFGSGVGTFVPVYKSFEKPSDIFEHIYANHAHNDLLEIWLETGVVGMILLGGFVVWMMVRSVAVWWKPRTDVTEFDCSIARAASVAIWLLIGHSLVDYPLRTAAMMAVFSFCCALLIEPLSRDDPAIPAAYASIRHRGPGKQAGGRVSSATGANEIGRPSYGMQENQPQQAGQGGRWGEDLEWPSEWSSKEINERDEVTKNGKDRD